MIVQKGIKEELRWFYEARFGMFVHFGLYALLGRGEWAMYADNIAREEYARLAEAFNPCRFRAEEWVQLAKDAGARYITVTAKHHDGFCLFDSALTEFKITRTPFQRDLIRELVEACHKLDMRIILYYSQPDWNHPNYVHNRGAFKDLAQPPETDRPDWPAYQKYYMGQVEELCTKYGRIDGIWFDGSHKTVEEWRGKEIYDLIKKYQPHAVVNDRGRYGDFFTPERTLPDDLTGYLFEACESVSPTAWGYKHDTSSFSAPHLINSLVKMTAAGGNYLLNVGPAPEGTIPEKQAQVMREIGKWLKVNGKAVYKTDPVFLELPKVKTGKTVFIKENGVSRMKVEPILTDAGRMKGKYGTTKSGTCIYFHCMEWPESDRLVLPGIGSKVRNVRLLSSGSDIAFRQDAHGVELYDLPCTPPDALVQVFELTFDEIPILREKQVPAKESPVIGIHRLGKTELRAETAQFTGYGVKGTKLSVSTDPDSGAKYIGGWWVPEQEAHWTIDCPEEGSYKIHISAGCPEGGMGSVIRLTAGESTLFVDMPETGSSRDAAKAQEEDRLIEGSILPGTGFVTVWAGTVKLPAGVSVLSVSPEKLKWGYVFGKVEKILLESVIV